MTTAFRITQTTVGEPKGGVLGTLFGGNEPGNTVKLVAETDEVTTGVEAAAFIIDVATALISLSAYAGLQATSEADREESVDAEIYPLEEDDLSDEDFS